MMRALFFACTLLLVGSARAAHAQDLEPLVNRIADAWKRADASAVSSFAAGEGVSIEFGGARVGPVPPRQAAAALRKLFEGVETLSARVGMIKEVGGSPRRAFVDITWTTRSRGTTIPQKTTVFLALMLEGERWRVTEIRHIK
jgi:hypothetical protein